MNTKTKTKTKSKTKAKTKAKSKTKVNTNVKKYNKNNNKKIISDGGGSFLGGIIQTPQKKNYTVPGQAYVKMFNPNLLITTQQQKENKLSIVFNKQSPNPIDIAKSLKTTILDSNVVSREPYLFIDSMGKYLIVMYSKVIKNQILKKKLFWIIGYMNRVPVKIFNYMEPEVLPNTTQNLFIQIYKYPVNDKTNNFIKINTSVYDNNSDKAKKQIEAYDELNIYLTPKIISKQVSIIKTINFIVKGNPNQGFSLFNMMTKSPTQSRKMMKLSHA